MKDTPHSILLWCNEQDDRVKSLQDICLDNPLNEEAKEIFTKLVEIQNKIIKLSHECENNIQL